MPVAYQNFDYVTWRKHKPIFVPNDFSRTLGADLKRRVQERIQFPDYYYHLRGGGHVAALHDHRAFRFFCKVDIENFFYSISRSRVGRALKENGIDRHVHYAKWSCVKNPYHEPKYSLPHGFVQSPILASLVFRDSPVGTFLEAARAHCNVAVYVDDISLAANDLATLEQVYSDLKIAVANSGFKLNASKISLPANSLTVFNCDLRHSLSTVQQERIEEFYSEERTPRSSAAFDQYCNSVSEGNED